MLDPSYYVGEIKNELSGGLRVVRAELKRPNAHCIDCFRENQCLFKRGEGLRLGGGAAVLSNAAEEEGGKTLRGIE